MTTEQPPLVSWNTLTWGALSLRYSRRTLWICVVLLALLLAVSILTLAISRLDLSAQETWAALWGQGEASAVRSVQGRRLPRLLTACGVGGALAVSGAVFQSLSRNPLGSPDIIGFTTGAATAATVQMLVFGGGVTATAIAALLGGLVTAALVYGLSRRHGVSGGLRLVLVGVGVGAIFAAITDFLMVRADVTDAATVQVWTAGSLVARGWGHVAWVWGALLLAVPCVILLARRIDLMEMGDDVSTGLGVSVEKSRVLALCLGVVLVGVGTAAAGPIAFIALAAPHITRRVLRTPRMPVLPALLTGAVLLAAADLLSQSLDFGVRTPVGLITGLLGGAYLLWLLARRV